MQGRVHERDEALQQRELASHAGLIAQEVVLLPIHPADLCECQPCTTEQAGLVYIARLRSCTGEHCGADQASSTHETPEDHGLVGFERDVERRCEVAHSLHVAELALILIVGAQDCRNQRKPAMRRRTVTEPTDVSI